MYYTIDRIEGDFFVCIDENKKNCNFLKHMIVGEAKEGSVLLKKGDFLYVDPDKTEEAKKRIENKLKKIFNK